MKEYDPNKIKYLYLDKPFPKKIIDGKIKLFKETIFYKT